MATEIGGNSSDIGSAGIAIRAAAYTAIGCFLGAAIILIVQCTLWLTTGIWPAFSVITMLYKAGAMWATGPSRLLGVWAVLQRVPVAGGLVVIGLVLGAILYLFAWRRPSR
jgi:hypothetical protein